MKLIDMSYRNKLSIVALFIVIASNGLMAEESLDQFSSNSQAVEIHPDYTWNGMQFGWDIDAEGDMLVASNFGVAITGSVYTFKYVDEVWTQVQRIIQPSNSEDFGVKLDLNGESLIVSATDYRFNNFNKFGSAPGAAYVYELVDNLWVETGLLFAEDGLFNQGFANEVKIYGDTAIVAAPESYENGFENYGAVYIYNKDPKGVWSQTRKLQLPIKREGEFFGVSIDLGVTEENKVNGDRIVVGTLKSDAVYIFELVEGSWYLADQIFANDYGLQSGWGRAIALENDTLVITSPYQEKGLVNVFKKAEDTWELEGSFTNLNADNSLDFGSDVVLHDDKILVNYRVDPSSFDSKIQNMLFQYIDSNWRQTNVFQHEHSSSNDGQSITDTNLFIGVPKSNRPPEITGTVYSYNLVELDFIFADSFE